MASIIYHLLVAISAALMSPSCTAFVNPPNEIHGVFVNNSTKCGREILSEPEGSIQYKVSEPLDPNERCVWVIHAGAATGYTVNIISFGFPEPSVDHQVTITGFRDVDPLQTTTIEHLGTYDFSGIDILLVAFHSGTNASIVANRTGFHLEYVTLYPGPPTVGRSLKLFMDASVETNTYYNFNFSDPSYQVSLGLHMWNWADNVYKGNQMMKMVYLRGEGWDLGDSMEVYSYNPASSWVLHDDFEDDTDRMQVIESQDVLLFEYRKATATSGTELTTFGLANFECMV